MLSQTQVGPLATTGSIAVGTQVPARAGNMGESIVSELQPKYYESAYRRANFSAANQAAVATSAALTTTYTGLCLSNPVGSTVNVVPTFVGFGFIVAPAAPLAFGIAVGYNGAANTTHTTAVTPRSDFVGVGASPVALVDAAATLSIAPTVARIIGSVDTGAITTAPQGGGNFMDLAGSIVLPPGAFMILYTSTASGASGFLGSISWTEVPV